MALAIPELWTLENNHSFQGKSSVIQRKSQFVGHTYRILTEAWGALTDTVSISEGLKHLSGLTIGAFTVIRAMGVKSINVGPATAELEKVTHYLDCARIYHNLNVFLSRSIFKNCDRSQYAGVLSSVLNLSNTLVKCIRTVGSWKLINLNRVSMSLSQTSIFGLKPLHSLFRFSLARFCLYAGAGANLFGLIHLVIQFHEGNHSKTLLLQLAAATADLAMELFLIMSEAAAALITASTFSGVAGVLMMISAGFNTMHVYHSNLKATSTH